MYGTRVINYVTNRNVFAISGYNAVTMEYKLL